MLISISCSSPMKTVNQPALGHAFSSTMTPVFPSQGGISFPPAQSLQDHPLSSIIFICDSGHITRRPSDCSTQNHGWFGTLPISSTIIPVGHVCCVINFTTSPTFISATDMWATLLQSHLLPTAQIVSQKYFHTSFRSGV